MTTNQHYISSLTPLRGIAAIWVMLFHIDVIIFYRGFGSLISHETSGILTKGYLWVDFFFLLSGFIISHVYGNSLRANFLKLETLKSYLWSRFSRIYPLHLFTLLLLVPFVITMPLLSTSVIDGSWQTFFSPIAFFENLFLLNSVNLHSYLSWNIVSWSIGSEFIAYVAAVFIIPIVFNKNKTYAFISFGIAGLAIIALAYWRNGIDITYDFGWVRCISEFTIGTFLYLIYINKWFENQLKKNIYFLLNIVIILFLFHFKWNDLWVIPVFSLLILNTAYNRSYIQSLFETKLFKYLGDISYSIYMMHGFWFMIFWFSLPFLKSDFGISELNSTNKIIYSSLFISCTLISAHFSYKYIEILSRNFLRRK